MGCLFIPGSAYVITKKNLFLQILSCSGHSCQDYIYSLGTLYGVSQPFAICEITTALAYLQVASSYTIFPILTIGCFVWNV